MQLVHFTVDLDGPEGEETYHSCCQIGGVTGHQLGETGNFHFEHLLQYFLQDICIVVTRMDHIIGNQYDGQYEQVKTHNERHRRPQAIFPVVHSPCHT